MRLSHLAAGLIALACLPFPASAQAQAETIACPDQDVEVNITAGMPEGWSSAAVGVRLSASEVRAEGDAAALVCLYDPAGALVRDMPEEFEDCAPAPGGFECAPIEAGRLIARGRAILAERAGFDLDTGTEQADRRLNDIWFTGTAEGSPVLETFNNTTFSVVPPDRPARLITCQEGRYDSTRVAIGQDVPVGGAVCYQTDEGRFGMFNVVRSNETEVRLRFRTIR